MKDEIAGYFTYCERFHCLYIKKYSIYMFEVSYDSRTSYMSNYFYCHIDRKDYYDAEHDLLVIAKVLVKTKNKLSIL